MKNTGEGRDPLLLCYELICPGLGMRKYLYTMVFITVSLWSTYIYISPDRPDYSSGLNILLITAYWLNIFIVSNLYSDFQRLDIHIRKLSLAMIFPGLDLLFFKNRLGGVIVAVLYLKLLLINYLLFFPAGILYIVFSGKIYRFKKLTGVFLLFSLFMEVPGYYLQEVRNKSISIVSESMEPTLKVGGEYLVRCTSDIHVGDIGVFSPSDKFEGSFAKRVVAEEGDIIYIEDDSLYINNIRVRGFDYRAAGGAAEGRKIKVRKDMLYVLGDNTERSYDSREFGMIHKRYLYGKVVKEVGTAMRYEDRWKALNSDLIRGNRGD